jgi:PAS domain S-box-containing protein
VTPGSGHGTTAGPLSLQCAELGSPGIRVFMHNTNDDRVWLAAIIDSSDDAILSKTLDGIVTSWNRAATRIFGYLPEEMIGQPIMRIIPQELRAEEVEILSKLRRGERIEHFETVRLSKDGHLIDISLTISPVHDEAGNVIGASKIARDITEKKRAEKTRQLLLNELNHRVKNMLASVQAIVQGTLRNTSDPAQFVDSFSGRIQSLARVHSLLSTSTWYGADLRELIRDQIMRGPVDESRLTAWGPAVHLEPQMALHIALMLHELGTNSLKYGALSASTGWITVSWTVRRRHPHAASVLRSSSKAPRPSAARRKWFGNRRVSRGRSRCPCQDPKRRLQPRGVPTGWIRPFSPRPAFFRRPHLANCPDGACSSLKMSRLWRSISSPASRMRTAS